VLVEKHINGIMGENPGREDTPLHSRRRAKQFGGAGKICPNVQKNIFSNV